MNNPPDHTFIDSESLKTTSHLNQLFCETSFIILVMDSNGHFLNANQTALDFLECEHEEILKTSLRDYIIPGSDIKNIPDLVSLDKSATFEINCLIKGKDKTLILNLVPVTLAGQKKIYGIGQDITLRKSVENNLRIRDEFVFSLFEGMPNPMIVYNMDDSVNYINPALETLTGYTKRELVGGYPPFPYWPAEFIDEYTADFERRKISPRTFIQRRFQKKNGEYLDVELSFAFIKDTNGRPRYNLVVWTDITERIRVENSLKESEEKYRLLVENAAEAIVVLQDDKFKFYNNKTLDLIGCSSQEMASLTFSSFIHPEDRGKVNRNYLRRLKGQKLTRIYEFRIVRKDLAVRWVSINAVKIDWKGRPAVLAFMVDVTERKVAEEKLEAMYKRERQHSADLEQEARERSLFIDVLAHELKTPMTPIMASSALLQDILASEPDNIQKKIADNIYNSSQILNKRLDELLDLARSSRGTFKLNLQDIDLKVLLCDVIARFKPGLDEHGQKLEVVIADNLPVSSVDPSRLEQVILNLLSNASKFSPETDTIYFKAGVKSSDLIVEVTDHGIGIAPEDWHRLFRPYQRLQTGTGSGLGLGLAVSKQVVEAHGGQIWLNSEPGKGSTFSFSIPLKAV